MSDSNIPRVAVIGAGDLGQGWTALALSHGWPVAIFDSSGVLVHAAQQRIADRVETLIRHGRAGDGAARRALAELRVARSLLQAVTDADWIIEATPGDLVSRQRGLEQIEQVARLHAITTSASADHPASALVGRLRHPGRLMVAHALDPVELMPAVEIVPGPGTDPHCVDDVRFWLRSLGRVPVVLSREAPGNVLARITAAVWRECIQLVLDGTLDVRDIDAAISLGPGLGWAAAGPHLSTRVSSPDNQALQLGTLLNAAADLWPTLASRTHLDPEEQQRLGRALERAYPAAGTALRRERDERLATLLRALHEAGPAPGPATGDPQLVLPTP